VTPYAIENKGAGIYWLHVYDNNWPDQPRYLTFNLNNESWAYNFAALNPGVEPDIWQGDARTDSLMLRPTSAHLASGWACPFCRHSGVQGAGEQTNQVEFQLLGEGQLLVIDAQGRGIGYEFTRQQFINEIDGAEVQEDYGGLGLEMPPLYRLPQEPSQTPYIVYVAGQTDTQPVDADLLMSGPGFAVGLEFIQINPGEDLLMTIRPDGRQITFNASEEGTFGPDIFLALDPDPAGDSYSFDVGGFELESFKTVTVTLDLDSGLLLFTDDDGAADTYALNVLRIGADGTQEYFANDDVELGGDSNAALNFGAWDGAGAMAVDIDGEEQMLPNEHPNRSHNRSHNR
ncbi:MAG TPA: hypothetical protein PKE45_14950, partial [Caldilineaceae bacterium]|nr:hypothetical protein [Caldilineaceae bacterium]